MDDLLKKKVEANTTRIDLIMNRIDASEEDRRKRHEEVMATITAMNDKLLPVFDAFDFRRKLDEKGIRAIVRWSKVLGFVLLIIALIAYLWKSFVFGVNQIK